MRPSILITLLVLAACTPAHRAIERDGGDADSGRPSICGDLYVNIDVDEQCDDGNTDDGDGCDASCQYEIPEDCGNDVLNDGEDCDDGANEAGDGCGPGCWIEGCGNHFLDPGEACEDGNTVGGDGCSADCKSNETCNNGIEDPGEGCDDGNGNDGDECPASCEPARCGDGFVRIGVESCDDGNDVADDGCTECILDSCGNGTLDEGEECDLGAGNGLGGTTCFKNCISTSIVTDDILTAQLDPHLSQGGMFPNYVDHGDFNGDGRADLLIGDNSLGASATVYGLGDGQMWPAVHNFSTSGSIRAIEVVDVNGDGRRDAVSVGSSDAVMVMLGDGTTFGDPAIFTTVLDIGGDNPFDLAIADLTGDGNLDVVTANTTSNDAVIMVGAGDGSFVATTRLATQVALEGDGPQAIAVGDVTGDGKIDIVTANRNSDDVSLFAGLGAGAFSPAQIFTTRVGAGGDAPVDIVITDVTNDGVADVIVACSTSADVVVLAASGGALAAPQTFTVRSGDDAGVNPSRLFVADVTQDGIKDLVTANSSSSDISVLAGLGPGVAFGPPSIFSVNSVADAGAGRGTVDVFAVDISGDSILDLVAVNSSTRDASVLLGIGGGAFGEPRSFRLQTDMDSGAPVELSVADINDDGRLDLISAGSGSVTVLAGLGDGILTSPQYISGFTGQTLAPVDLNADGLLDFVGPESTQVISYIQFPNGEMRRQFGVTGTTSTSHVAVGEFTGDTAPDVASVSSSTMVMLSNDGTGQLTLGQTSSIGSAVTDCVLADINGDNTLDLLMPSTSVDGVFISTGTGTGSFASPVSISTSAGSSGLNPVRVAVADLNGDQLGDIVTANSGTNDLSVLLGEGSGVFEDPKIVPTVFGADPAGVQSVAIGDFNSDGLLDLVAANSGRDTVSIMLGFGDGLFAAPQPFTVVGEPISVTVADFDGDGIDDVAVVSRADGTVTTLSGFSHPQ